MYSNDKERIADVIIANSVKMFSKGKNCLLEPASELEKAIDKEERAAATARLAIDKAMSDSKSR